MSCLYLTAWTVTYVVTHLRISIWPVEAFHCKPFYQSSPSTYYHELCFPVQAPHLSTYFSTCVDRWVASCQTKLTGRVVVDNAWQTLFKGTYYHDGCGCTAFHRTEVGDNSKYGLRGGEQDYRCFTLHFCYYVLCHVACEQVLHMNN